MNGSERALHVVSLAVPPRRRHRFVEEWHGDLLAARSMGLRPAAILIAAFEVALLLLWMQVRPVLQRSRGRAELLALGSGGGLLLVMADAPVTGMVPFVVLVLIGWAWARIRSWIVGAS